ncbi:ADP-ribosylation/Crystallin J1 [Phycomyces nitens]|nr:ADP-ribosylation/Crystallin J1 [Phycomyces nitens]
MRIPSGCSKLERADIIDRVKGMIFGAILGDSLGLATEGMTREQVQKAYSNGPIRFGMDDDQEATGVNFVRDTFRALFDENDFGDDAEQQLLILFSIQENRGTFNYKDYAARLHNYSNRGMRGLDKQPLGIKSTTKSVLSRGSLVRAAILGIPKFWDGTTVIQNSAECCRITHPDPRSIISSIIVSTIAAR